MKVCIDCKLNKESCDYRLRTSTKDGRDSICKVCIRAREKIWRINNPDKIRENRSRNRTNNLNSDRNYRLRHKAQVAAKNNRRRCSKLLRTPSWLTQFDLDYIKHLYIQSEELSKITGVRYHVDHIIPLQGVEVSGLHVPWNLQIIEATDNLKKGNRKFYV